jgi:hypothetical protein
MTEQPNVDEILCPTCSRRTVHQRRLTDGVMECVDCRVRQQIDAAMAPPPSTFPVLVLVGGLLAVVGVLLPWISLGAISRSGMDMGGDANIVLGAGLVACLIAAGNGSKRTLGTTGQLLSSLAGLSIVAVGVVDYQELSNRVRSLEDSPLGAAASVGLGLYVCIAGGVLTVVGGLLRR